MGADNTFGETNFNPNKMKTEHTTEICFNCGASIGLHHYETLQCPKNGVEAPLNKKQEWNQRNTFEDNGLVKLHDAAPEQQEASILLYNLCRRLAGMLGHDSFDEIREDWNEAMNSHERAIKKAAE